MPTHELVVRPILSADAARWSRLVTLLAAGLGRYLSQQPMPVDLSRDLRVYADVPNTAKEPTP